MELGVTVTEVLYSKKDTVKCKNEVYKYVATIGGNKKKLQK